MRLITPVSLAIATILATGCATTNNTTTLQAELDERQAALDNREATLSQKENDLSAKEMELRQQAAATTTPVATTQPMMAISDLLPPDAQRGECYARVWQPAQYKTLSEEVLIKEASEKIEVIPAVYQYENKVVQVSGASSKLISKPAVYGTEQVKTLVRDERTVWRETLSSKSPLTSEEVIEFAKKHTQDDIAGATPGMCFHEHREKSIISSTDEKVLVSEAYDVVETIPAQYEMVDQTIVVKEASTKIVEVPATYKTETKKILVKPATTVWKKGTGPIQRIDAATGEIMCLVEVPAEYKIVKTRVIDTPATTKTINVPEVTKVIQIKKEVAPAKEVRKTIPATYKTVTKTAETAGNLVWHEVHDGSMTKQSRTGRQMCLVKEPALYKTTTKRIVKVPASTQKIDIPEVTKTMKVRTLVSAASETRTTIPAVYKTVQRQELVKEGNMEWRSILCETNMTNTRISQIQQALKDKGFDPGKIDGVAGRETMQAMNAFQKANNLPIDKYLNVKSIRALGVSEK